MELSSFFGNENYCPITLPSVNISVLQLLLRSEDGILERLGEEDTLIKLLEQEPIDHLRKLFETKSVGNLYLKNNLKPVPSLERSGIYQLTTQAKGGLKLPFAGDNAQFSATDNDKLVFAFESPTEETVRSVLDLDKFLNQVILSENSNYIEKLKKSELYIVTSVLKTKKLVMGLVDSSKWNAELKISSIQELISGHFTLGSDGNTQRFFKYEQTEPIIFAAKVAKIHYDRTLWQRLFREKGLFHILPQNEPVIRNKEDVKVAYLKSELVSF